MSRFDEPAGVNPRGTVVVVPGRGEHAGVYARLGRRLAVDAYRVRVLAGPDDPGLADLLTEPDLVQPVVLLGSDAGALRAVREAVAAAGTVQALVLGGLPVPRPAGFVAPVALGSWDAELDVRTRCPAHRGLLDQDADFVRDALAGPLDLDDLAGALEAVNVPTLVVHGGADVVSPIDVALPLYRRIPGARVTVVVEGRHDVFNDIIHRSVAAAVVLFLEDLRLGRAILADAAAR